MSCCARPAVKYAIGSDEATVSPAPLSSPTKKVHLAAAAASRDVDCCGADSDAAQRAAPAAAPASARAPKNERQAPLQHAALATPPKAPRAAGAVATAQAAAAGMDAPLRLTPGKSPNCARPTVVSTARAQEQQAMRGALPAGSNWKV